MKNIWNYVDRIVTQIVKPQKLLYVAVDGVAPRAKMNQQRSRRFRSAKDAREAREEAARKGIVVDEETIFDSNCITPGTEFMAVVDAHLQYFIRKKVKEDPRWRGLTIIYSGHAVPGEGEHKIMQYIRDMKASPAYQPNLRHCMYGQDADLIMLALATHEPHFTLLREVIDFGRGRGGGGAGGIKAVLKQTKDASFQLLHLSILREYMEFEFLRDVPEEDREEHLERVVDDFVFLTFLVGNDFLPHLPSLDISEHAFDRLFEIYGQHFQRWGGRGYLTEGGKLDAERLQAFFEAIGEMEDDIFEAREEDVAQFNARRRRNAKRFGSTEPVPSEEELAEREAAAQSAYEAAVREAVQKGHVSAERAAAILGLRTEALQKGDGGGGGDGGPKKNYRGRYYFEKLGVLDPDSSPVVRALCKSYVEGLAWCLAYYVTGCVSWNWFFPYHYGPLMGDVKDLKGILAGLKFDIGEPFHPFEQLLGCLPAASAKFLPRRFQFLMTSPTSPIIDFYPPDFNVDMNGKHNPWEGVVLIPFIDEGRLKRAIADYCPPTALTQEEKRRNAFGKVLTFKHSPAISVTVPSCNPSIFPDIHQCGTSVTPSSYSKESLTRFEPRLVPGTVIPSPGFPSLKVLPISGVRIEAIRINVHGSESRYRTICLSLPVAELPGIATLAPEILGRPVYVNWPMMHEARIAAVTDGQCEYRLDPLVEAGGAAATGATLPTVTRQLAAAEQREWGENVEAQQKAYLYGRGVVGLGGLEVGSISMMLKVRPLQGLERDPRTGATRKVFGTHEAEVPIQLAMWSVPTADPRFLEQGPVPLEDRLPLQGEVVVLDGKHRGLGGRVVGHTRGSKGGGGGGEGVRVEVEVGEPDRPIGLLARKALGRRYYDAGEVIRALSLDGRVLGKISGSCFVDPGKHDLGLNLKIRGRFVLPDYVRRKVAAGADGAAAWAASVDVVRIVGSADPLNPDGTDEPGGVPWEYSEKAVLLIRAYMESFPRLFEELRRWPNEVAYDAQRLLGANHAQELERIRTWLAAQETALMPRVPLTTHVLPREAIRAIERSADELQARRKKGLGARVRVETLELAPEAVVCAGAHSPADVPRRPHGRPELGDRVVNLLGLGVPFGLKGTVVALHRHSACVEVLFDEEFIGGTSLQGTCSPYRGKLLPWSALLKITVDVTAAVAAAGGAATAGGKAAAAGKGGKKGGSGSGNGGGGKGGGGAQTQVLLSLLGAAREGGAGDSSSNSSNLVPGAVQLKRRQQPQPPPQQQQARQQQQQQQQQQQPQPQQQAPTPAPAPASSSSSSSAAQEKGRSLMAMLKGGLGVGGGGKAAATATPAAAGASKNGQPTAAAIAAAAAKGQQGAFGGHRKAQGPQATGGFALKRSRAQAPSVAEWAAEEAEKEKAREMTRVMSLLAVKEKGNGTENGGGGGGDASSSLKSMLNINGQGQQPQPQQQQPQQQQGPPMGMHPQQQHHHHYPGMPPMGYGYPPAGPPGAGPGFYGPPQPYFFPPSMPRGFMPPHMMMPPGYYGGAGPPQQQQQQQQQGGGPVPRRVTRSSSKKTEAEGGSGGGGSEAGAGGGSNGGTAKAFMPSQALLRKKKAPAAAAPAATPAAADADAGSSSS